MNRHRSRGAREEDDLRAGPPRPRCHHPHLLPDRLRLRGLGDPHPGDQGRPRPVGRRARPCHSGARGRLDRGTARRRRARGAGGQPRGTSPRLRRLPGRAARRRAGAHPARARSGVGRDGGSEQRRRRGHERPGHRARAALPAPAPLRPPRGPSLRPRRGRPPRQRRRRGRRERDRPSRRRRGRGTRRRSRRHLLARPRPGSLRRRRDVRPPGRPATRPRAHRVLRVPPRRRRLQLERRPPEQRARRRRRPGRRRLHALLADARGGEAVRGSARRAPRPRPGGPRLRCRRRGREPPGHRGAGGRRKPRRVGPVRPGTGGPPPHRAGRRAVRGPRIPRRGGRGRHHDRLPRLVHRPAARRRPRRGREPLHRSGPARARERRDGPPRAEGTGLNLPSAAADASVVSVNDLVLVQGMDDTKRALRRWNDDPLEVLRPWFLLSFAIALGLLAAVYVVATLTTPDPTLYLIPGYNSDPTLGDYVHVLILNSLVLALHALACVAGFMAGSSLPPSGSPPRGMSARVDEKAGPLAIGFVVCATAFSLCTQAYVIGGGASSIAVQLGTTPGILLLALAPHALPELIALFLPLAAWIVASRQDDWQDLLAATFVTVAIAVPVLPASAAVETWVSPQLLLVIGS